MAVRHAEADVVIVLLALGAGVLRLQRRRPPGDVRVERQRRLAEAGA